MWLARVSLRCNSLKPTEQSETGAPLLNGKSAPASKQDRLSLWPPVSSWSWWRLPFVVLPGRFRAVQEVCVSATIVAHQRIKRRKERTRSRTLALVERDIYAVRTRVYAHAALRRYFLDERRAALAYRLERLMAAMGMGGAHP